MNRLLTLASTGLFATGLAILPLSVNAATVTETKAPVTAPVAVTETKAPVTAPVTGPDGKAAPVVKSDTTAKDATKPNTATTAPVTTTTVPTAATATAKPATTQPPAHDAVQAPVPSGSPAKVGG